MTQAIQSETSSLAETGSRHSKLRDHAGWIVAFGIILAGLGAVALSSVVTATLVSVYFVGLAMIVAGVSETAMGFRAKSWGNLVLWMILGVLYAAAGMVTLANPLLAAGFLTLVLGASLVATGFLRVVLAIQMRSASAWGWIAVSGAITALLGAMTLAQWPASSLFALGVFLSVDLLFAGFGWITLGMALSRRGKYL